MKKVELLAPAGNYEALLGAIAAGADAVYLGGDAFGARAYAHNFTREEICEGIQYAHVFHRKIYLTVNTLVKEREFAKLYDFLLPFYEAGLDGAIIQDFGVFTFIREHFPGLELHASTQMTITGTYGAGFLKKEGASRIVPARELTLSEIKAIKDNVDIEIETFIHGAMCYCYSGQCLLSSILGGRSGNRGRCAQPCRLPYRINGEKEEYSLSMKDMCTINILPELIEAGIDSFKIEGRMKKPEYAAGVTAIYRKYIDMYYDCGEGGNGRYHVSKEDMEHLKSLYIRSSVSEGYYHQHNGRDMITLSSPAYSGSDEKLFSEIKKKYIDKKMTQPVAVKAVFRTGEPSYLSLVSGQAEVCIEGEMVQKAQNMPLSRDKILAQLQKSGGTCFEISSAEVDMDDNIFMPVSVLNQLRRDGLFQLQKKIIEKGGFAYSNREPLSYDCCSEAEYRKESGDKCGKSAIHALINTKEQFEAACLHKVKRIYVDKLGTDDTFVKDLLSYNLAFNTEIYLAFPFIVREKDKNALEKLWSLLASPAFDGALVRNLETIEYLEKKGNTKPVVADINLYAWNRHSYANLKSRVNEVYFPVELNLHEWKELQKAASIKQEDISAVIYGRLPMMISAGCVRKTSGKCGRLSEWNILSDRYQKEFPVYNDCTYCYNIIYNSVPLSLHRLFDRKNFVPGICRLDFTVEEGKEAGRIIEYFQKVSECYEDPFYSDFTTGHYKRGVE